MSTKENTGKRIRRLKKNHLDSYIDYAPMTDLADNLYEKAVKNINYKLWNYVEMGLYGRLLKMIPEIDYENDLLRAVYEKQ